MHHTLDRRAVVAVECGECGVRQPPAANCTGNTHRHLTTTTYKPGLVME